MKERGRLRRVGADAADFLVKEQIPLVGAVCIAGAGEITAHGQPGSAILPAIVGGSMVVFDYRNRQRGEQRAFARGVATGFQARMPGSQSMVHMGEHVLHIVPLQEGEAYYTSLDGERTITDPMGLLEYCGEKSIGKSCV